MEVVATVTGMAMGTVTGTAMGTVTAMAMGMDMVMATVRGTAAGPSAHLRSMRSSDAPVYSSWPGED